MQAPTHFLTGVLIYEIINLLIPTLHPVLFALIVFITAFFSHFLVDAVAKITYHVPDARPDDKFWLIYHIFIFGLTAVLLILFWNPYWIALLGSIFIDLIDWGLLRAVLKKEPVIHPQIDKFRAKFFSWLPDLIEKKWTVVNEFIILGLLLLGIYLI